MNLQVENLRAWSGSGVPITLSFIKDGIKPETRVVLLEGVDDAGGNVLTNDGPIPIATQRGILLKAQVFDRDIYDKTYLLPAWLRAVEELRAMSRNSRAVL